MTTATDPPLIDEPSIGVDELHASDQPDERVCEIIGRDNHACRRPAVWALTFRELCGCSERTATLLLACDGCRRQIEDDWQAVQCLTCGRLLPLLRAEPL